MVQFSVVLKLTIYSFYLNTCILAQKNDIQFLCISKSWHANWLYPPFHFFKNIACNLYSKKKVRKLKVKWLMKVFDMHFMFVPFRINFTNHLYNLLVVVVVGSGNVIHVLQWKSSHIFNYSCSTFCRVLQYPLYLSRYMFLISFNWEQIVLKSHVLSGNQR